MNAEHPITEQEIQCFKHKEYLLFIIDLSQIIFHLNM